MAVYECLSGMRAFIENEEDKLCAYPSCTNSQVVAPSFASQSEIIFFFANSKRASIINSFMFNAL